MTAFSPRTMMGALHQLRVLLQEAHHCVSRGVVGGVEAQRLEVAVLADERGWRLADKVDEARHRGRVDWGLEVLNDIELDVSLAQDFQRATRFASPRVVIDDDPIHVTIPRRG